MKLVRDGVYQSKSDGISYMFVGYNPASEGYVYAVLNGKDKGDLVTLRGDEMVGAEAWEYRGMAESLVESLNLETIARQIEELSLLGAEINNCRLSERMIIMMLEDSTSLMEREIKEVLAILPKLKDIYLKAEKPREEMKPERKAAGILGKKAPAMPINPVRG